MKKADIVIVGGGAAGLMAAVSCLRSGISVLILEKMERVGRKIRITGKGRCNITNMREWEEFSRHVFPNATFFRSAFYHFPNTETVKFFNCIGVATDLERGERVFPISGRAADVAEKLEEHVTNSGGVIYLKSDVRRINCEGRNVRSVSYIKGGEALETECKALIIATGGMSYPLTGSDGYGLKIANELGHTITECFPSLTALMPEDYNAEELKGLLVKNCTLRLISDGKCLQEESGDIEFTRNGLEGPLGFRVSRKAVKALINGNNVVVSVDFKPALTEEMLMKRVVKELTALGKTTLGSYVRGFVPAALSGTIMRQMNLKPAYKALPDDTVFLFKFIKALKNTTFKIAGYTSYERAVVTAGGINQKEIVPKSMRSKLYDNLYFAGEIIDLDGDTGGYNLQIAFSTGALAGYNAAQSIITSGTDESE